LSPLVFDSLPALASTVAAL
jgi:hypothetical protein